MTDPDLATLRDAIDAVDEKLLSLLTERVRLVLEVGTFKRSRALAVYDPARERQMMDRLSARATLPLDEATVRRLFERIIDESRRLEQRHVAELARRE